MMLNVPDVISGNNILFVGIGGGYDVMGSLPIAFSSRKNIVFANYSRTFKELTKNPESGIEGKLFEWLAKYKPCPVYALPRAGVKKMLSCLQQIVQEHKIDSVIAIDGGVDSLMHGNEEGAGTILEDFVTLAAINSLSLEKILVCVGFGTELEEEVCHAHVLDNMTLLAKQDALLGSCMLTRKMNCFDVYKAACEYVWQDSSKSHVQTKIISSVCGEFLYDNIETNLLHATEINRHISPLMSLYWFFDLEKIVKNNIIIPEISQTNTHTDVLMLFRGMIDKLNKNKRSRKILPY